MKVYRVSEKINNKITTRKRFIEMEIIYKFVKVDGEELLSLNEAINKYEQIKEFTNPNVRIELQGQPIFSGFLSPMFDGFQDIDGRYSYQKDYCGDDFAIIRYETSEVYEILSN